MLRQSEYSTREYSRSPTVFPCASQTAQCVCVCVYVGRQSRGYAWLLEAKCHPVGSGRKGFAACVNHIVSNLLILKSASQN